MSFDSLFPRPAASVAVDLAGLSFSGSLRSSDVPIEVEDSFQRAHAQMRAGDFEGAAETVKRLRSGLPPSTPPGVTLPIRGLEASARMLSGDAAESEAGFLRTLADAKASNALATPLGVSLLNNLAVLTFTHLKRPEAAQNQIDQALACIPDRTRDTLHQRPTCLRNLGLIQDSQGDRARAAASLKMALEETHDDPRTILDTVELLVANREKAGDLVSVEALLVSAFSVMARSRIERPDTFVLAARNLSLFLLRTGELERLGPIAREQAQAMRQTLPDNERWRLTPPVLFLALHYANDGNWARASSMIDWALQLDKSAPPSLAGTEEFLRHLTSYFRKEGLLRQFTAALALYRMSRAKRSGDTE